MPRKGLGPIKREFAKRLFAAMISRGLNQSEFARRVETKLKENDKKARFGRDSMSGYIRGRNLPLPHIRKAIADVLGMKEHDLLPDYERPMYEPKKSSSFEMRELDDGNMWLRIDQPVDREVALEVVRLVGQGKKK